MRTFGFAPTRADPDIWTKKDSNCEGHTCMSTHMDNFLMIVTNPEPIMESFKKKFGIRHEEINPTSCLGLQWEHSELRNYKIHNEKHAKEAISQVKKCLGIQSKKESVSIYPKHHPELEEGRILVNQEATECQKFIGTL